MRNKRAKKIARELFDSKDFNEQTDFKKVRQTAAFKKEYRRKKKDYVTGKF